MPFACVLFPVCYVFLASLLIPFSLCIFRRWHVCQQWHSLPIGELAGILFVSPCILASHYAYPKPSWCIHAPPGLCVRLLYSQAWQPGYFPVIHTFTLTFIPPCDPTYLCCVCFLVYVPLHTHLYPSVPIWNYPHPSVPPNTKSVCFETFCAMLLGRV